MNELVLENWVIPQSVEYLQEAVLTKSLDTISTPEKLLKWMDAIQYGWISKKDNKVRDTNGSTSYMLKNYYLQSPEEVMDSKVGTCWDQSELERMWFYNHKYKFHVFYMELQDNDNLPSHTFLVYKTPTGYNWFEHSWGQLKGIHEYETLNGCVRDAMDKFRKSHDMEDAKVVVRRIRSAPKSGIGIEEYMKNASREQEYKV